MLNGPRHNTLLRPLTPARAVADWGDKGAEFPTLGHKSGRIPQATSRPEGWRRRRRRGEWGGGVRVPGGGYGVPGVKGDSLSSARVGHTFGLCAVECLISPRVDTTGGAGASAERGAEFSHTARGPSRHAAGTCVCLSASRPPPVIDASATSAAGLQPTSGHAAQSHLASRPPIGQRPRHQTVGTRVRQTSHSFGRRASRRINGAC